MEIFREIPFLNGGLFECLDCERGERSSIPEGCEAKIRRVDGFSDQESNVIFVPNELFFGKERNIDLNEIYGTHNKHYKVRGLLLILNDYKFTIEENTPIEEEIALDPELLGRVFENLLAAYNPETQTTARKATGSYYTPREIVNYMVDESLLLYLDQKLREYNHPSPELDNIQTSQSTTENGHNSNLSASEDIDNSASPYEEQLRELFSYGGRGNPFDQEETQILIKAIDEVKVLDPACGSGAFPMGVLHRLVFLLGKLDPHNRNWKQRQLDKMQTIEDLQARDAARKSIEHAFETNELNYGRKLYLIQNCIYGVDVQPIAVQIARLRFFISLIVDQKIQIGKNNKGITSLPNLESKFVAANTIMDLEKPTPDIEHQMALMDDVIDLLKNKIKSVHDRHFNAHNRAQKETCIREDKELRRDLSVELHRFGWSTSSAQQFAEWDPFDQNKSAPFFDAESMFGMKNGFDIIIGNPPYLESRHPAFNNEIKTCYQKASRNRWKEDARYITRGSDLLIYFIETAIFNINNKGNIVLITQNSWLDTRYGKDFQQFLLKFTNVRKIVDSDFRYFKKGEGPSINTIILIIEGKINNKNNDILFIRYHEDFQKLTISGFNLIREENSNIVSVHKYSNNDPLIYEYKWGILHDSSTEFMQILELLKKRGKCLNEIDMSVGQGLNLKANQMVGDNEINKNELLIKASIPLFTSNDGALYNIQRTDYFIIDKTDLPQQEILSLEERDIALYDPKSTAKIPPRLILPRGIGKHYCALNSIDCFSSSCVEIYDQFGGISDDVIMNLWLFLNSSIAWLLREVSGRKNLGGGMLKAEAIDIEPLPIYFDFNREGEIRAIFTRVKNRQLLTTSEEIYSPEHKQIDEIVFNYLGISDDLQSKIIFELHSKIVNRDKKSTT